MSTRPPGFRFTITQRANDKDNWQAATTPVETFIANLIKRGHAVGRKDGVGIIGAVFAPGAHLEGKNVVEITAVILDFDGKSKVDGKLAKERLDVNAVLAQLPFRGGAHSSHSHRPEFPKFRVILPLAAPVDVATFRRMWSWLWEATDRKADPSCKNADRMYFLPRCTAEAKSAGWPWVRELHGPLLTAADVPADYQTPVDSVSLDEAAPPARRQGVRLAPPETRAYRGEDPCGLVVVLMVLPIFQWAIDNPNDVTYLVWLGLGSNLAAAVRDHEGAHEAGRRAFHTLSAGYTAGRGYRPNECDRKWKECLALQPMRYATLKDNDAPDDICDEGELRGGAPIAHAQRILWVERNEASGR